MTNINNAAWFTTEPVQKILTALNKEKPDCARLVGGCVRNTLMGQPVEDIDIATQLPPNIAMKAVEAVGGKTIATGIEHGTFTTIIDNITFEITSLRRDVETDGRHAVITFTDDWEEDAQRRDFRLNAIYADAEGNIYDVTGNGIADAKSGRVVFIGAPEDRIGEDYLRILRFFRFNAWYGNEIDKQGLAGCVKLCKGLGQISAERIWMEWYKLLSAPDPYGVINTMQSTGILSQILPQSGDLSLLERLIDIETGQLFTYDPIVRLMSMIPRDLDVIADISKQFKFSNTLRKRLENWVTDQSKIVSYLSALEIRSTLYRIGSETFIDRVKLGWANDPKDSTAMQWRGLIAMAQSFERPEMPLSGKDVISAGVPAGPKVGEILSEVEDWWIDAHFPSDKFSLIERLKAVAQAIGYD